jgi:hypothetical protein
MHRQTLQLSETVLGNEHPDTLMSTNNLAIILRGQGKYGDASTLYQKASLGYRKTLGVGHPTALACSEHYTAMLEERRLSNEKNNTLP